MTRANNSIWYIACVIITEQPKNVPKNFMIQRSFGQSLSCHLELLAESLFQGREMTLILRKALGSRCASLQLACRLDFIGHAEILAAR